MAHETPPQDPNPLADLPDPEDEPVNAQDAADTPPAAPPVLNRAERRAQAKGKSSPSGAGGTTPSGSASRTSGGRAGGHVAPVRFPRTGHK